MKILVDIGNSRIKWGLLGSDSTLQRSGVLEQGIVEFKALLERLHPETPIDSASIVCVAQDEAYRETCSLLQEITGVEAKRFTTRKNAAGVKNAYRDYQSLGADRWAALIAGYDLYSGPLLICDCGTALTLDLVDVDGNHMGGYIMPGLSMARRSLRAGTAHLPQANGGDLIPAADSVASISNGTLLQLVAAIEQIANEYGQPNCVLTGGDAVFIGSFLSFPFHHDPDLVLKGLAIVERDS